MIFSTLTFVIFLGVVLAMMAFALRAMLRGLRSPSPSVKEVEHPEAAS